MSLNYYRDVFIFWLNLEVHRFSEAMNENVLSAFGIQHKTNYTQHRRFCVFACILQLYP